MGVVRSALGACLVLAACAHAPATPEAAWAAWRSGDAAGAAALARRVEGDEGYHVAALAAHVRGDHAAAIAAFSAISQDYPRRRELRTPIFESYLHAGRATEAVQFAAQNEMSAVARARAEARAQHPLHVTIAGVVTAPFTEDALTPYMPGVAGRVNGADAVFRIDTGGAFVNMSPALATQYGVRSDQCGSGFANLQQTAVCYGVADIELGAVRIGNAPVAVIGALPAETEGVPLGPVLGANFFEQFLGTVDSPHNRLILSARGDAAVARAHRALLRGVRSDVPFLLWSDHYMLARGGAGARRNLMFFVDSGLVAVGEDRVQAALLASQTEASAWSGAQAGEGIVDVPNAISLGDAAQSGLRAMVVPDAQWAAFGRFGGISVNALVSYGFLKRYAWTMDFDRQVLTLTR